MYKKYKFESDMVYVISDIDGLKYKVRNLQDKQTAANTLAKIRANLVKLVEHLKKLKRNDVRILIERFNPNSIQEGTADKKQTSVTIEKGEQILFCLRSRKTKTNNRIHNLDMLMYVALHEMAHIMSISLDHTEEFIDNFAFLLKESAKIGIYNPSFLDGDKEYCGLTIEKNSIK